MWAWWITCASLPMHALALACGSIYSLLATRKILLLTTCIIWNFDLWNQFLPILCLIIITTSSNCGQVPW